MDGTTAAGLRLASEGVRIDPITARSSADVDEQGLLQLGHRKEHRPALPQRKLVLANLDPLGMPLAPEDLSGEHADDPVPLPIMACVRDGLKHTGRLSVGDGKMAALQTRATLAAQKDCSWGPLSALQAPPEQVIQEVESQHGHGTPLIEVSRGDEQGASTCIARATKPSTR